jgi:hypothetical protein
LQHIGSILDGLLAAENLRCGMANYALFSKWREIVGEPLAKQTRPLRVQGTTLVVYAENATLNHHLTFLAPQILERIREKTKGGTLTAIRFTTNMEY